MKLNLHIGLIIFNLIVFASIAQKKNEMCSLQISATAFVNHNMVGTYAVSVYQDGSRIDSVFTYIKRPIKYSLAYNQVFTFLFQKQNYDDKIVIVNTTISKDFEFSENKTFDLEVEMLPAISKNKNTVDHSVAIVLINKEDNDGFRLESVPAHYNSESPKNTSSDNKVLK